jgi:hypothetical protein
MKTSWYPAAMRLRPGVGALLGCLTAFTAQLADDPPVRAQANPTAVRSDTQKAEVALALSACPPAVAKGAAVYVLGQSGYVKVRDSQNGFTALVQHTVPSAQEPRCMGAEGTRTWLPRILKVAKLRAEGKSREEIQQLIADALAKGVLKPPSQPGVDYMLSTQNRVPNQKGIVTPFPPHLMFYAPYLTNADLGVDGANLGPNGNPVGPVFVAGEGGPYALIIVPIGTHGTVAHEMPDLSDGAGR